MKLSKASDYALVLLSRLADESEGKWISAREVAETIGIPQSFLGNIIHQLVQAGILISQRGSHGGVKLSRSPGEITIGQVLEATADRMNLVECMDQPGACPIEGNCDVRAFWSITHELVLAALKHITLKDIHMYMNSAKQKGDIPNVQRIAQG